MPRHSIIGKSSPRPQVTCSPKYCLVYDVRRETVSAASKVLRTGNCLMPSIRLRDLLPLAGITLLYVHKCCKASESRFGAVVPRTLLLRIRAAWTLNRKKLMSCRLSLHKEIQPKITEQSRTSKASFSRSPLGNLALWGPEFQTWVYLQMWAHLLASSSKSWSIQCGSEKNLAVFQGAE